MNLVEVKRISYYPPSKGYAVLLQEKDSNRSLPIIVGSNEAQAIALYLEGVDMPRPMTHDLLINVLDLLESDIKQVTIARMSNGTFFAEIEVSNSQVGDIVIDSRPSDAIAVALRTMTPIYVSDEVMERAGIDNYSTGGEVAEPLSSDDLSKKEMDDESVIENLSEALEKAISEEEYEVAARLRDRIKQLEKKSTPQ
jgi:bifunctional DNase/RNase